MRRNGDRSGITLVEILVTTSLVVVMVGALFVVQRGVSRQSQTTDAKREAITRTHRAHEIIVQRPRGDDLCEKLARSGGNDV